MYTDCGKKINLVLYNDWDYENVFNKNVLSTRYIEASITWFIAAQILRSHTSVWNAIADFYSVYIHGE